MTPLRFWQSLLCLGRPPRISLAPCAVPAHMDVMAYHPLSVQNPDQPAGGLGIGVADIDKLRRLLDTAQLTGRVVPSTGTQLWVTELNWDLTTPSRPGATPAELARWIPRALYLLWRGGVSLVTWEFLRDPVDPLIHLGGLWSHNPLAVHDITGDQPKPQLAAFTFPLTVPRVNRKVVEVWSLLPNSRPGPVSLQRLVGGRWRLKARLQAGVGGMVDAYVRLRGSAVVRLVAPGVGISPPAAVSRKATPFPSPPPTVRKSPSHRRTTRSRRR